MANEHDCRPPSLYPLSGRQLSWTCGECGREWHAVYGGFLACWEETRGPRAMWDTATHSADSTSGEGA
jgi:hypothetical protein